MIVTIEGTLNNIFKGADFRSKETGEVKEGKLYAQLLTDAKTFGGATKRELIDIPLTSTSAKGLENKVGQAVGIKCSISSKDRIFYEAV